MTRLLQRVCLIFLCGTGAAALQPQADNSAPARLAEHSQLEGDAARVPLSAAFAVKNGHAVELYVDGFNLRLEVTDSDGNSIRQGEKWDFPCERLTPLRLVWIAVGSEDLRLRLTPLNDQTPAPYRVRWTRHGPASARDKRWDRAQGLIADARQALESGQDRDGVQLAREAAQLLSSKDAGGPSPARVLESLADLFWVKDWEFSRSLLKSSADWRRSAQGAEHPCLADTLSLTATLLKDHGLWDQALDSERRALEIRQSALGEDHVDAGVSLYNLGVILEAQARFQESEESFRQALKIFEVSPKMEATVPTVLYSLGEVLRVQNRSAEAETLFRQALDLAERRMEAADPVLPKIMTSLGGHFRDRGELRTAEEWTRRSLQLKEQHGADPGAIANGALNLAEILRLQARYEEAEPLYLKALREARHWMAGASPELAWFINQAARFYQETGRPQRAGELYIEAAQLLQTQSRHPLLAQTLHDLAELEFREGDRDAARQNAARALKIREEALGANHPDVAASLVLLARTQLAAQSGETSEALLDRALGILEELPVYPDVQLEAFSLRARVQRAEGRAAEAVDDLTRAARILEELRTLRGGGDLSRAALLAQRQEDFHLLARWHFQDGRPGAAVEALERHRGRVFLDRVRLAGVDLDAGIPAHELKPLREEENRVRALIAGYQQQIQRFLQSPSSRGDVRRLSRELEQTLRDYRQIQERIRNASPVWRDRLSRTVETVSLEEIQSRLLGPGDLMLIYQIGADASLAALIPARAGDVEVFDLSIGAAESATLSVSSGPLTAETLEEVLAGRGPASILGELGDPQAALGEVEGLPGFDSKPLLKKLHALWKILTPPEAWSRIREAGGVVVIPDAALHQLPFEALVVSVGHNSRDSGFWLDQGPALRYAPSASVLRSIQDRAAQRRDPGREPSILSVSNPSYVRGGAAGDGEPATAASAFAETAGESAARLRYVGVGGRLEPLPGTALETEALVAAFGPRRVLILQDAQATESRVRQALAGKRYVHLATHGIVGENQSDLLASLALTPPAMTDAPAENDGFLQLFEIYQLRLDAELTVLSACETNLGRRVAGEGVFALSSGFLAVGSSRVLASQWRVDDESAARLIGAFFEEIADAEKKGGPVEFARALRAAKKKLRERPRTAPPYFWAPFVLAGLN